MATHNLGVGFQAVLQVAVLIVALMHSAHAQLRTPISRQDAIQLAASEVARLVNAGRLDKSWKLHSSVQSAELVMQNAEKRWIVAFVSENETDEPGRILVVSLSVNGAPLAYKVKDLRS